MSGPVPIPVIAIDGPSASGKGTVAHAVARRLGFHYLDSGAIYRALAVAARLHDVALDDEPGLAALARAMSLRFEGMRVWLEQDDRTDAVRSEQAGNDASAIAALPGVATDTATALITRLTGVAPDQARLTSAINAALAARAAGQ